MLPETMIPIASGLLISSDNGTNKKATDRVGSLHPDYTRMMNRWALCRDVVDGEDAVRTKGTVYLPKPTGMDDDEYSAFSLRASFTNATGRSLDGLDGLIWRKKPTAKLTPKLEKLSSDITTTGLTLDELAKQATREVLTTGRGGLLIDMPLVAKVEGKSLLDAEVNNERPYMVPYIVEDILNWREGKVRNIRQLTWVKLREWDEDVDPNDPGKTDYKEGIREVYLGSDGFCKQLKYFVNERETAVEMPIIVNNAPIDYVPFIFLGPVDTSPTLQKPPVYDIAVKNIHHWQVSADRAHAVHWADCPTPVVKGTILAAEGKQAEVVKLGSTTVLNISSDGDAYYLEFKGEGLVPTKELMNEYMAEMAILLSRILAGDSKAAEAAETAAIHRAGENAVLASIANTLSNGFTKALKIMARWLKEDENEVSYRLNTNFYPTPMSSQMLIALTNAMIAKTVSMEEFFDALIAGDVIRPDKTIEEHKEEIAKMPTMQVKAVGAINPPGGNPENSGSNSPDDQNGDTRSPGNGDDKISSGG